MKDQFEDFIEKNREAFDHKVPSGDLWAKMEDRLPVKQAMHRRLFPWRSLSIAAGFLILLGLVGTWGYSQGMKQGTVNSLADISQELGEMETHYQSQINEKMTRLASFQGGEEVKKDIKEMEAFLEELKLDLKDTPKQEREVVINAMIENYRARLEILQRVLDHLPQNSTDSKLSKDESISI